MVNPEELNKKVREEEEKLRQLRSIVAVASSVIREGSLSLEEVEKFLECIRNAALELFPGKEEVYDLIYQPRFRRLITEVYRLP